MLQSLPRRLPDEVLLLNPADLDWLDLLDYHAAVVRSSPRPAGQQFGQADLKGEDQQEDEGREKGPERPR